MLTLENAFAGLKLRNRLLKLFEDADDPEENELLWVIFCFFFELIIVVDWEKDIDGGGRMGCVDGGKSPGKSIEPMIGIKTGMITSALEKNQQLNHLYSLKNIPVFWVPRKCFHRTVVLWLVVCFWTKNLVHKIHKEKHNEILKIHDFERYEISNGWIHCADAFWSS